MLLLIFTSLGILVLENEVNLVCQYHYEYSQDGNITLLVAPHLSGPNMIT